MAGVNRVIIVGRLGQDPELKYFSDGTPVCNFSMATSETWKDKQTGEKKEKTEWHRITTYRATAENCAKYLAKGRQAYVEGKLQTREWTDKDSVKRYTTEIIADMVQFLGSAGDGGGQSGGGGQSKPQYPPSNPSSNRPSNGGGGNYDGPPDDDIPF